MPDYAPDEAAPGDVRLCSQCGERLSVMVKIGTTDGWCTVCLDEAASEPEVDRIIATRVAEAERRGGVRALRDAASDVAQSFPYNGELRPDGSEDPTAAAYVEGLHTAHQIISERADRLAEGGDQ